MNFASPERLIWLAVAVPIIVLYLLRTRLRRRPVATLLFWDQLFEEKRRRSWWQQLRHWLSLMLQLAFLLLVVGALVDPLWRGGRDTSQHVVIVLDNSASMAAATGDGSSRFEQARREALRIVSGLRDGDQVALVTAGSTVRVAVGMTDFPPAVRDAIEQVELTDGPARVAEAVETAGRLARPPQRQVVVVTDACFDGAEELTVQDDVFLATVGEAVDNVGITSLAVRRSLIDPIGYAARIEVENFGKQQHEFRLTVELADELVDVVPVTLAAGEVWKRTIPGSSADGGFLSVRIDVDDALATDNQAWAVLGGRPRIPVRLVTEEPNLYLEGVLAAIPLVDLTVTASPPTQSPEGGFTVLHRIVPDPLPGGALMVIDPQDDSELWTLGRQIEQAFIATQESKSPLMPHVRLTNVVIPQARELEMADGAVPLLIDADGAVLMASLIRGGDRTVVLAAGLDSGDLPLRIAFPVMMTNAVNWFLGRADDWQPSLRTGEVAKVPLSASQAATNRLLWRDASGRTGPAAVAEETATIGPIDRVGPAELGPQLWIDPQDGGTGPDGDDSEVSQAVTMLAVNLCDREESDLKPRIEASTVPMTIGAGQSSPWFYLAAFAFVLVAGEWFLYQRRIIA